MSSPLSLPQHQANPLVADALQRAKALASERQVLKRPSEEYLEGPNQKKYQQGKEMDMNFTGGPGMTSEQVMVPDNMVGLIIGRGGEQITKLQADSGCKIQMAQDSQGLPHRLCTLTGTAESIGVARSMIDGIIANEGNRGPRGMGGGMGGGGMPGAGGGNFEMMIPGHLVARVIGKGGEVIKALQEETGAKIVIIQESKEFAAEKLLKITGPPDKVEFARMRVDQVIAEEQKKMGGGGFEGGRGGRGGRGGGRGGFRGGRGGGGGHGGGWPSSGGGYHEGGGGGGGYDITETIAVPGNKVGLVMGKGGETISAICRDSGAHCQVDKNAPEGAREKNIVLKGPPEAIERAKQMIYEKVGGGPPSGGNYGGHRGGGGGSQGGYAQPEPSFHPSGPPAGVPGQGGPGQPDYSAQWAEYYRSLGMHKEAELIEQQMQQRATAPAPVTQQPPAAAAQPDYSAQWAEYYRSIGKDKEAEAIEAQMRAKTGPGGPGGYGGPQPGYGQPQPAPGHFQPQPQPQYY